MQIPFGKKQHQEDEQYFTFYDSKTQSYGVPMPQINQHSLIRDLMNMFRDPGQAKNQLVQNAEDFAIYKVGSFDKKTGVFQAIQPTHVVNLHELRATVKAESSGPGIVPT